MFLQEEHLPITIHYFPGRQRRVCQQHIRLVVQLVKRLLFCLTVIQSMFIHIVCREIP